MRMFALFVAAAGLTATSQAIYVGLYNDFQNGTLQDWSGPNTFLDPNGGPAGAGDAFAHTTSDGVGQGGRLAMFNTSAWTGNYQAAGVTRIEMMVKNMSAVQLEMRVVLFDAATGARWTSATPLIVAPGAPWTFGSFSLAEGDLVRVLGTSSYQSMIVNVGRAMIRHDAGVPSSGGTPIVGAMGVDNILAVPEPGAAAALAALCGAALRRRARRA
jgi:hypothetical protein